MRKTILVLVAFMLITSVVTKPTPVFYDAVGDLSLCLYQASSLGKFVSVSQTDYKNPFIMNGSVKGQCVKNVDLTYTEQVVKRLGAKLSRVETLADCKVLYYYTDKLSDYKTIDGDKINLQVVEKNGVYAMGTPMIFEGF